MVGCFHVYQVLIQITRILGLEKKALVIFAYVRDPLYLWYWWFFYIKVQGLMLLEINLKRNLNFTSSLLGPYLHQTSVHCVWSGLAFCTRWDECFFALHHGRLRLWGVSCPQFSFHPLSFWSFTTRKLSFSSFDN